MNRQEQIEAIAKFCGIVKPTKNVRNDDYRVAFNPFVSNDDAALVRRRCEERGWLHLRRWNGSHSTQITARHTYTGDWSDNENESFMSTLLLTIEAEGSVK